ncbi:MAG: trehalose-phosphatase [Rhizobiales bacterium]|nr:trehalose-phosphatase [Hyphomicrobiales bacterium]
MEVFARLHPAKIAILLDVDGTLIDIGPSPFEVRISDDLRVSLQRLLELTGGALALVSGRPIADLDRLFMPLKLPTIGGHGAEMRAHGSEAVIAVPSLPQALRRQLAQAEKHDPAIVVEDKGYSLALHFRNAPQQEHWLLHHIATCCAAFPNDTTEVLPGKAMYEVKRPAVNKGESVRRMMRLAPFAGRMPVFVGDDVTDESVFQVLPDLGGMGFSVTRQFPGLAGTFESPAHVRQALQVLGANGRMGRA